MDMTITFTGKPGAFTNLKIPVGDSQVLSRTKEGVFVFTSDQDTYRGGWHISGRHVHFHDVRVTTETGDTDNLPVPAFVHVPPQTGFCASNSEFDHLKPLAMEIKRQWLESGNNQSVSNLLNGQAPEWDHRSLDAAEAA